MPAVIAPRLTWTLTFPEILFEIVQHLTPSSISRLVQTCKVFQLILTPTLYAVVDLKSPEQIHAVLPVLQNKSEYVRILRIRPIYLKLLNLDKEKALKETWVSSRLIKLANGGLSGLKEFNWDGWELPEDDLWIALKSGCPQLKSISVTVDKYGFNLASSLFAFEDLQSFCIRARSDILEAISVARTISLPECMWQMLLYKCPNLESLELISFLPYTYRLWNFDPVFLGTWPKLKRLTLGCFVHKPTSSTKDVDMPPSMVNLLQVNDWAARLTLDEATPQTNSEWGENSEELLQEQMASRHRGLGLDLGVADTVRSIAEDRRREAVGEGSSDTDSQDPCAYFFLRHPHITQLRLGWNPYLLQSTLPLPRSVVSTAATTLTSFMGTQNQLSLFPPATLSSLRTLTLDREHPYALLSSAYISDLCDVLKLLEKLKVLRLRISRISEKRQFEAWDVLLQSVGGIEQLEVVCPEGAGETMLQPLYQSLHRNLPNLRSFSFSYHSQFSRWTLRRLSSSTSSSFYPWSNPTQSGTQSRPQPELDTAKNLFLTNTRLVHVRLIRTRQSSSSSANLSLPVSSYSPATASIGTLDPMSNFGGGAEESGLALGGPVKFCGRYEVVASGDSLRGIVVGHEWGEDTEGRWVRVGLAP
ncbi:hypothetical protein VKT23_018402 [Stygiomarasmius scandens]|uniref:F-box domain-containing protein n=1 Tax=Marasmiellus scandens TaxID=2682957 RepID=A0ABR1IT85_9AGAR